MDLFNRKLVRQLEQQYNSLRANLLNEQAQHQVEESTLRNQVDYLIREIRKMDDIIFSMSQCTDWNSMRPRFVQLQDQMTARKVAESNRINSLITGELHSTYQPPTKQIGSKS